MSQTGITYRNAPQYSSRRRPLPHKKRANRTNTVMLRVFICLAMVALLVYFGRMAAIYSNAKAINQVRQEIHTLEENRQHLEIALSIRQNLDRVRDEATGRLGMVYPEEIRVVSLSGYSAGANAQTAYDTTMP